MTTANPSGKFGRGMLGARRRVPFMSSRRRTFGRMSEFKARKIARSQAFRAIRAVAEKKYFDSSFALTGISNTGMIIDVTTVTNSDDDTARIGDKLTILSYNVTYSLTGGDQTNIFRVILFQWIPNSAIGPPAVADILETVDVLTWYNHDNGSLFRVLYDRIHSLTLSGANQSIVKTFKIRPKSHKFMKKTIDFQGSTSDGQNKLYVLLLSDSGAVAHPSIRFQARMIYIDT